MPRAAEVTPAKWTNIRVLFDDSTYSVIAGDYDGNHCLGERWNGDGETLGFPNEFGYPVWHIVYDPFQIPILHGILHLLALRPADGDVQAILDELALRRGA